MKPLFNILIRTSGRPQYFARCIDSIRNQTYKNYRILVSGENDTTRKYVISASANIEITYHTVPQLKKHVWKNMYYGKELCSHAPYNLHLNTLQSHVKDGWIIYCDDDDMFATPDALQIIADNIQTNDDLVMWRALFPFNKYIPYQRYNQDYIPECNNIGGGCIAFHSKYKDIAIWDQYTKSDYRVIKTLFEKIENKRYINEPLVQLQRTTEMGGHGQKDDMETKVKFTFKTLQKSISQMTNISLQHSGNIGDIIASLPTIKLLYEMSGANIILYLNTNKAEQKRIEANMSTQFAESVKTLLDIQPYIHRVIITDNPPAVTFNLDKFRLRYADGQRNILYAHLDIFGLKYNVLQKQYIHIDKKQYVADLVINRTPRYQTGKLDYAKLVKKYKSAIFVGTKQEYESFCTDWQIRSVKHYKTDTILEIAQIIAGSKHFAGNGSMCMTLAVGLNHLATSEMHPHYVGCNIQRENLIIR